MAPHRRVTFLMSELENMATGSVFRVVDNDISKLEIEKTEMISNLNKMYPLLQHRKYVILPKFLDPEDFKKIRLSAAIQWYYDTIKNVVVSEETVDEYYEQEPFFIINKKRLIPECFYIP